MIGHMASGDRGLLTQAAELVGLVTFAAVVVHLVGGAVIFVRLWLQEGYGRVTLVAQLPRDLLFSTGLIATFLPLLITAGLYLILANLGFDGDFPRKGRDDRFNRFHLPIGLSRAVDRVRRSARARFPRAAIFIGSWRHGAFALAWASLLLGLAIVFAVVRQDTYNLPNGWPLAILLLVVFVIGLGAGLGAAAARAALGRWYRRQRPTPGGERAQTGAMVGMAAVAGIAFVPFGVTAEAFVPLEEAKVCTSSDQVVGQLVGETGNRV
jgi:hypothetical protein